MTLVTAEQVTPPGDEWGRFYSTARNILDRYVDYFAAQEVPLPLDEKDKVIAFVSDGTVAYDAPLFAAEVIRRAPGIPGTPAVAQIAAGTQYALEITLHLVRPVPTVEAEGPPAAEEIETAAQLQLRDWWTFEQGAIAMTAAAREGGPANMIGAPFRRVAISEIIQNKNGGLGGTKVTLSVDSF